MADIHDRMPVILDSQYHDLWLDPEFKDTEKLQSMLRPYSVGPATPPERMSDAVVLYQRLGFVPIAPYWNNVLPGIEYMELKL